MKVTSALIVFGLLGIFTNADEDCVNNPFFSHNYDAVTTCEYIRNDEDLRQFFCKKLLLHVHCALTCGVCGDETYIQYTTESPSASPTEKPTPLASASPTLFPTNSPTLSSAPTVSLSPSASPTASPVTPSPTAYACVDDTDYGYQGKKKKSCTWIGALESRKENLCKKNSVKRACKIVCGECCEDDTTRKFDVGNKKKKCNHLKNASKKKKNCPTSEVNEICAKTCGRCCLDDPTFEFMQGKNPRKCEWLVGKKSRINRWCEGDVMDACPFACESCVDYTAK